MSWKSLVTAGLFCVLAVPAFAAPQVTVISSGGANSSGHLDASGRWVWTVQVAPDLSLMPSGDVSGTPLAVELGLTAGTVAGKAGTPATNQGTFAANAFQSAGDLANFDTLNPGKVIYGWESTAGCNANGNPCGIQTGTGANNNKVFAALGSVVFTTGGAKNALELVGARPVVDATNFETTMTVQVTGAYSSNGRVAQINGGTSGGPYTVGNFDTFGGASYSYALHARGGDADLNGTVNFADYTPVSNNYLQAGTFRWDQGDFDGNGVVNFADYSFVSNNYLQASYNYNVGVINPAAGSGSGLGGGSVPEPASVALLGLAVLGGLGVVRRKR